MIKEFFKYAGRRKAYSGIRSLFRGKDKNSPNAHSAGGVNLGPKLSEADESFHEELAMIKGQLQSMDPYEFEKMVGEAWENRGYTTNVVGGKGDGGIDVIASSGRETTAIQCKRYGPNTRVSPSEIRETAALSHRDDVSRVALVTTNELTEAAKEEVSHYDIDVYDGEDFMILIDSVSAEHLLVEYLPGVSFK